MKMIVLFIVVLCLPLKLSGKYLGIVVKGATENVYLYEDNQDYLLINGIKRKVIFNNFSNWKASGSNIKKGKNVLHSLLNLRKLLKNKKIKLILYGYYVGDEYQIVSWSFKFIYDFLNFFDINNMKINKYNLEYGFKVKGSKLIYAEYEYAYEDHTGEDVGWIYIKDSYYSIYIDKIISDKEAMYSFWRLKWEILDLNSEYKIKVIGHYDKASKMFILKHWYIVPPFKELVYKNDKFIKKIKRWRLKKSDFRWRLKDDVNIRVIKNKIIKNLKHRAYNSNKYFYRKYKIVKINKFKKENLFKRYIIKLLGFK